MVKCVEPIVVGEHNVCIMVEQQSEHIVALFRDSIVKWRVPLAILEGGMARQAEQNIYNSNVS